MVYPVRCFVKWFTRSDSQASSPRSDPSSKGDYDWSALDEERLEYLLWEWHRRSAVLIRGLYLLSAVLRTWRQLCSIDAEITDAMYQQRLLRNVFAAWRIFSKPTAAIVDMEFSSFASES